MFSRDMVFCIGICIYPESDTAVHHQQVMASMGEALARISQTKADLASSIRQAASWLGHRSAQSATPAQHQQVRNHFQHRKATEQSASSLLLSFWMQSGGCGMAQEPAHMQACTAQQYLP